LKRCKHRSEEGAIVGAGAFVHTTSEDVSPKYGEGNASDGSEKHKLQKDAAAKQFI
jgi:hypothetical protein